MDPVSAVLINKALDGLSMRMEVIAQNIANAQTDGYRPMQVSFEDALMKAKDIGPDAVRAVKPEMESMPISQFDGEMRIDLELAKANATGARYGALIDLLNRQMQMGREMIKGGQG